jgi:hypothetical protein
MPLYTGTTDIMLGDVTEVSQVSYAAPLFLILSNTLGQ